VCGLPSAEDTALVEDLSLTSGASYTNAKAVEKRTGWAVVGGFALFERVTASPATPAAEAFVIHQHWWNERVKDGKGVWIDLTPRVEASHAKLVLVESAKAQPAATAPEAAAEAAPTAEQQEAQEGEDDGGEGGHPCCRKGCPRLGRKRCGVCRACYYCSVDCQKAAWPEHKLSCQPFIPSYKRDGGTLPFYTHGFKPAVRD